MNTPSPLLFWAKLGDQTWPVEYHPVICHLIDVGQVARRMWNRTIQQRTREWVTDRLGLADPDAAGSWLAFWAATHDIGKVSFCFQVRDERTDQLKLRLEDQQFKPTSGDKRHGVLSTEILAAELESGGGKWPAVSSRVARNVAVAVGGHHGLFPADWDKQDAVLGNEHWTAARHKFLAELARLFGVTELPPPCPTSTDDQSVWMFVAGFTSVADWIGSNQTFFKPFGNEERLNQSFDADDYFRKAEGWALEALDKLGWLERPKSTEPVAFRELFPKIKQPRRLQEVVEEIVKSMDQPGLVIVEAPMGEGKTEAAWYAATCWDRRSGQGTYVALPTMATSNQMFDRVTAFLKADGGGHLMLMHGKAALNKQFEQMKLAAENFDDEKNPSAVVAEGWFASNKKHGLLAPYGVGTIDQALLAVLQTKHVFVRLFGLAGKCVILDEVHAYDAYMTTLMERLLRWLAALGCPVVLLSATLPRERRQRLIKAYAPGAELQGDTAKYPRITVVRPDGFEERHVEADPARARTVRLDWRQEDNLTDELRRSLADGGCAVVIRNTVGLAQATYLQLRDALKDDRLRVELFHARFPFGRRQKIERRVLRRYGTQGKEFCARRQRVVLVATQVVEQSLDLDFDLMISDVAPVDLVLQRAGRLHRHERGQRPAGVKEPRLLLIQPEEKDGLPDFGRGSEYVYARFVLLRSFIALKAVRVIQLPHDLENFIERVYGDLPLPIPEGWQAELEEAQKKWIEKQENQKLDAMDVAINDADDSPLEQQCLALEEDDPAAAKKIQAQTRDSGPSIQLIVVYHIGGQDYLDAGGTESFDESEEPNIQRVRRLLANEVAVNHPGCFAWYVRQDVPKGWRKRAMLRYHRILRVDGKGMSLPGEFILQLHPQLGLMFKNL